MAAGRVSEGELQSHPRTLGPVNSNDNSGWITHVNIAHLCECASVWVGLDPDTCIGRACPELRRKNAGKGPRRFVTHVD
jgi:hypothetical protein